MTSDIFVAYFGLVFELTEDEVEAVELRSDGRLVAARKAELEYYWGNFGGLQERNLLLIGKQIALFGYENRNELSVSANTLRLSFEATKYKLEKGGFTDEPELHLKWQPDT